MRIMEPSEEKMVIWNHNPDMVGTMKWLNSGWILKTEPNILPDIIMVMWDRRIKGQGIFPGSWRDRSIPGVS